MASADRNDPDMIALAARDLIVAEAWYHKSCYRIYTKVPIIAIQTDTDHNVDEAQLQYSIAENEAYNKLFHYIRSTKFTSPCVLKFMELTAKLMDYMVQEGIQKVKTSTKKHLRRKLEAEFGASLHIFKEKSVR